MGGANLYRNILAPVDGSKGAAKSAVHAVELAKICGAKVIVLHVVDNRSYLGLDETTIKDLRRRLTEKGKGYVQDVLKMASGLVTEEVVREGYPAEVIVKVAGEKNVDLIVMGTRGLTGARRLLLGSTAEQVIKGASCPVLVVR